MEDLLEWPWLRFERFYTTFVAREIVERMERQRDMIIAALHANSVYDEHEEAKRDEAIASVEESFDAATEYVRARARGEPTQAELDDDYDPDDPFWRAAERGAERMDMPRSDEGAEEMTAGDIVDGQQSMEDVRAALAKLDQQ